MSYIIDLDTLPKAKGKRCKRMSDLIKGTSPTFDQF